MHIAIEGMDGVGKTTVARMLATRIGFRVVEKPLHFLLDEPGEVANYLRCRDYINQQTNNDALRAWFYGLGNLYLNHCFEGENIITDRHLVSNYYWCGGPDTEALFECLVKLVGKPDYTYLLYASTEEGNRRIRNRDLNDPDILKTKRYPDALKKMKSFLAKYGMQYAAIDTTELRPERVVEVILEFLPAEIRKAAAVDSENTDRNRE